MSDKAACTCDPEAYDLGPEGQKRYFPDRGCPQHGDPEWLAASRCHCGREVEQRSPDPWEGRMDAYCYECSLSRCDCYPDECPVKHPPSSKAASSLEWPPCSCGWPTSECAEGKDYVNNCLTYGEENRCPDCRALHRAGDCPAVRQ